MLVTTSKKIPGKKIEVIGLISANRGISILAKTELNKAKNKLIIQAEGLWADPIVGVRFFNTSRDSTAI